MLTLKDNHPTLCEAVQRWLDTEVACGHLPIQETLAGCGLDMMYHLEISYNLL